MGTTYSTSSDGAKKQKIDAIISKSTKVDMNSSDYLKQLISACSKGKPGVVDHAKGLQFFIVKGGAEGFLAASFASLDASRRSINGGSTTPGTTATVQSKLVDDNDLLIAFDKTGKLISSAMLHRPLSIPGIWTEETANNVYNAWDNRPVGLYQNTHWGPKSKYHDIAYYGLTVDDSKHYRRDGKAVIDMHKKEATNGCIFIMQDNTPPYSDKDALNAFEPKFILDVQSVLGSKVGDNIGTMHMLDVSDWSPPKSPDSSTSGATGKSGG
jgi:hypothetical protein